MGAQKHKTAQCVARPLLAAASGLIPTLAPTGTHTKAQKRPKPRLKKLKSPLDHQIRDGQQRLLRRRLRKLVQHLNRTINKMMRPLQRPLDPTSPLQNPAYLLKRHARIGAIV